MTSVLNKKVSMFASATDTVPSEICLLDWLTKDNSHWSWLVGQIRSFPDDKKQRDLLKKGLPAITPSGLFSKRAKSALLLHSGLLAFDIDNIGDDLHDMKSLVSNIPNIAYCGLSVSGNGLWGLIPVSNPDQHEAHFRAIEMAFADKGITIDKACKDVSRLRFYSTDPEPHINHNAVVFTHTYFEAAPIRTAPIAVASTSPIDRAVKIVTEAKDGEKWICLTKASFLLGGYVGAGKVDENSARTALRTAIAQHNVADINAAYHTIEKGLRDGKNKPVN